MKRRLPEALEAALSEAAKDWSGRDGTRRLFAKDARLWTSHDEQDWLGWLGAPAAALGALDLWRAIAHDASDFEDVVLLGMGGSSLCADVQTNVFGHLDGHPAIHVLDSTAPDQVRAVRSAIDPRRALAIVASKSGSTLEPNLLFGSFHALFEEALGADEAGRRFVAITDPGSHLEKLARDRGFRRTVLGDPQIGGRYSALSPFGLVPAAMQGLDVESWLRRATGMLERCRSDSPLDNPAVALGLLLGVAARRGVDKLTFVIAPPIATFGAWLEQLVAESTGKRGRGILPFDGEPVGDPEVYGTDRLFAAVSLRGELFPGERERLDRLAAAGHPVVEIDVAEPLDLSAEMARWEIATAVAGAILEIDPFDQPDVESAKIEARRLSRTLEETGSLPEPEPIFESADGVRLFAEPSQARVIRSAAGSRPGLPELLRGHLARLGAGDYFALLAFVPRDERRTAPLERLRGLVRDRHQVATALGFGPRFLHSTGQAFKGGPPSGVFLQVTGGAAEDLPIPGQKLSFQQVVSAQAQGDLAVLEQRGRRCLRVDLPESSAAALEGLADAVAAVTLA